VPRPVTLVMFAASLAVLNAANVAGRGTQVACGAMVRFLTTEWIAALDEAAQDAAVPAAVRLTIQQIVTGDGDVGEVRYHLVLDDGRLRVHPGDAAAADVTLVQNRGVAAALSRGELNAQQALEAGRLKLRGDIGHLARQAKALTAIEDVFAAVRADTTY
jgi:putative sterol carrier protein